jgi:hypothetical protein
MVGAGGGGGRAAFTKFYGSGVNLVKSERNIVKE